MTQKILVIAEDKITQDILSAILLEKGFRVSIAVDGKSALSTLETEDISVVFVDLDLTDMSCVKILQKAKEISLDTKIILLAENGSLDVFVNRKRAQSRVRIAPTWD